MTVNYHRPSTVDEAMTLAAREGAVILAGGTMLNAAGSMSGGDIIDLQSLDIVGIESVSGGVRIGAMTRLRDLVDSDDVPPLLRELARREGPNTLRNAATVGGTIVGMDPDSELLTGLLAFQAKVTVVHPEITTDHPIEALMADPPLLEASLVTSVSVPNDGVAAAERTGRTPLDTPIVSAVAHRDRGGKITMAMSGVADRPRLVELDHLDELEPPSDFRGTAEYRRAIGRVVARRVLDEIGGRP